MESWNRTFLLKNDYRQGQISFELGQLHQNCIKLDKKELILDDDTLKTFNQFSVSASFSDFLFSKSGTGNPVEEHGVYWNK